MLPLRAALRAADSRPRSDDLIAGLITAVLLVPQAMAYAQLAGLPPQLGLYAGIVPTAVYALFGSSRSLAVGPVAVAALMVASALANYAAEDPERWLDGAVILAAETGLVLLAMRALRLGALVDFISHPVLSGFTSGAAILILISQLDALLGLDLPPGQAGPTLLGLAQQAGALHWPTAACGAAAIVLLLLGRAPLIALLQRAGLGARPASLASRAFPLLLVFAATAAVAIGGSGGLAVVGPIPAGLTLPSAALFELHGWRELAPSAALIALVGYVESISVARVLAARRGQRIDANQELSALAFSNLAAAGVGTMPVAGGFSRSVVNFEAGARTQLAGLITAGLVALVALFLTPLFRHLPQVLLAAIIVVAVIQLIDLRGARQIFAYDRGDGATLLLTLGGVLLLGIEAGLVLGIVLALSLFLRRTSAPHMAVLGRVPGTEHFRNVDRHAVQCQTGVLILRVDENLYFANIGAVESFIEAQLARHPQTRALLLVMSAVNSIDATAEEQLERLERRLAEAGIALHFAEIKGPVMDRLRNTPLGQRAASRIHLSTHIALQALEESPA